MANNLAMNFAASYYVDKGQESMKGGQEAATPEERQAKPKNSMLSVTPPSTKKYQEEDSTASTRSIDGDFSPTGSPTRSTCRPSPMVASPRPTSGGATSYCYRPDPTGDAATCRVAMVSPEPLVVSAPPTLTVPTEKRGPNPRLASVDASSRNLLQIISDDEEQERHDSEEGEEAEKQDEEEKKQDIILLLERGERIALKCIHEKLEELPRRHAWAIAATVMICTLVFVISLTLYNLHTCQTRIAILDGEWWQDEFNPYKEIFLESSTRLCLTLGQRRDYYNDTYLLDDDAAINAYNSNPTRSVVMYYNNARPSNNTTSNDDMYSDEALEDLLDHKGDIFDVPCMLIGFSLTDFDTSKECPSLAAYTGNASFSIADLYVYDDGTALECSGMVSVVYAECPKVTIALGSALAFVAYVQIFTFVTCFILYRLFHHDPDSSRIQRLSSSLQESFAIAQDKISKK